MKILAEIETGRQKVTLAEQNGYLGLLINGCLQFHGGDQAALHELLVTLPLCLHQRPRSILVLGGGIGLTAREALRFSEVERVVLVEIDPELYQLTRTHPAMVALHNDAFADPRVEVIIADAFEYVRRSTERFDLVVNAIDVSYTPQDAAVSEQAIRGLWQAERALLHADGWLSECMNDVEIGEYFQDDREASRRELASGLGEGMVATLSASFNAPHAGDHVFAFATTDAEAIELRRPVPQICVYLDSALIRRFLKRGFLPGQLG